MGEYIEREAAKRALADSDVVPKYKADNRPVTDKIIDDIPAADVAPVVHWVLTDEKLPPDGQDVLCWYEYFRFGSYHRMFQTYGIGYQYNGMWGGEVVQGQKARVLAWIPLPEAPKIDGGTENASKEM